MAKTITQLLRAGHSYPDILGYTLTQTRAFSLAAHTLEQQQHLQTLIETRIALNADAKALQKHLDSYTA